VASVAASMASLENEPTSLRVLDASPAAQFDHAGLDGVHDEREADVWFAGTPLCSDRAVRRRDR
jgi:hypothetical protein